MTELFSSPPIDAHSRHLIERHGLVMPEDFAAGVYRLRDTEATYILSVDEAPKRYWYGGIPLLEVTLTGRDGPHMLVGRMDVGLVNWRADPDYQGDDKRFLTAFSQPWNQQKGYEDVPKVFVSVPHRPGLGRVRSKTRGWQPWAKYLANQVAEQRTGYEAFLDWFGKQVAAGVAAQEEAEMEAIRRQIDEDADAGVFDDL